MEETDKKKKRLVSGQELCELDILKFPSPQPIEIISEYMESRQGLSIQGSGSFYQIIG